MRAVVAMSGGVDSSVVAALLKQQGHEVIGITMNIWDLQYTAECNAKGKTCCSTRDLDDARRVCEVLDIPFYPLNFRESFKKEVYDPFISEYIAGRTPNPCVLCNTSLKFELLLYKAKSLDADILATGHYAQLKKNDKTGQIHLLRGVDNSKDQSYFLYGLTKPATEMVRFPLGEMTKLQVRELAAKFNLKNANKQESQDVCFVKEGTYADLVARDPRVSNIGQGDIVDLEGNVLGQHKGYFYYTIGQRRGLGVAAANRLFVISTDPEKNLVIVGSDNDLFQSHMLVENISLVGLDSLEDGLDVRCKIRSRSKDVAARIFAADSGKGIIKGSSVVVEFSEPQRAIACGQAGVFYLNDEVLGGGWIAKSGNSGCFNK